MKLGIIQCAKTKRLHPTTAVEMYWPSYSWRTGFQILTKLCDQVMILSDKYGLITPETIIKPYEADPRDLTREEIELVILSALDFIDGDVDEVMVMWVPAALRNFLQDSLPEGITFTNLFAGVSYTSAFLHLKTLKATHLK